MNTAIPTSFSIFFRKTDLRKAAFSNYPSGFPIDLWLALFREGIGGEEGKILNQMIQIYFIVENDQAEAAC